MTSSFRKSARRLVYRALLLHGRNHEEAFAIIGSYFDSVYDRHIEHRQSPTELTRLILRLHKRASADFTSNPSLERKQITKIINAVYNVVKDQIVDDSSYSVKVSTSAGSVKITVKPIEHEYALAVYEVEHPQLGIWHGCVSTLTERPMLPHHIDEFFDILDEAKCTNSRHIAKREKALHSVSAQFYEGDPQC